MRGFGHRFGADVEVELGVDDVDRVRRRALQRHHATAGLVVVDFPGAAAGDLQRHRRGAVVVGRFGVDALLDRGRQDEGLERGAGLALGLPGVVELLFAFTAFARGEGDDRPGFRVDRGEAGDRAAFVTGVTGFGDRGFGLGLQIGPDRRVGLEAAVADGVDPVAVDQFLLDQVEEEGVVDHLVLVAGFEAEPVGARGAVFGLADVALFDHRPQHLVAPFQRRLGVEEGVVFGGRLRQPGDHRRLGQVEVLGRFAEVGLRRRLGSDGSLAVDRPVRRRVEVLGQDPVAVMRFEEFLRQRRFLDLPLQRVFRVVDVEVADQLLGDRRGALNRLAAGQRVLPGGAGDALRVEGAVGEEVLVLDRDGRVFQRFRQHFGRDGLTDVVGADEADQAAVGSVDRRGAALLDRFQARERRRRVVDVDRPGRGDTADCSREPDDDEDRDRDLVPARVVRLAPLPADTGGHPLAIVERGERRPGWLPGAAIQLAERQNPPRSDRGQRGTRNLRFAADGSLLPARSIAQTLKTWRPGFRWV